MATVTIRILSGARRGEEIRLESDTVRVGDTPECEVYFDSRLDPAARGRSMTLRLGADGWCCRPDEAGRTLVNQAPVAAESRIRSGDVLRMSETGPDFLFTITNRPARISAAERHPAATAGHVSRVETASGGDGVETPLASGEKTQRDERRAPPPATAGKRRWLVWAGAALGAAVLATAWSIGFQRGPADAKNPGSSPTAESTAVSGKKAVSGETIAPSGEVDSSAKVEPVREEKVQTGPWAGVESELAGSVLLVQVEADGRSGSHSWPFATGTVIDAHTVLTSGRETLQLAEWHRQGYRILVTSTATGLKAAVKDFRVHREFTELAERPGDWIYADLGLLITEANLPEAVRLASAEDLRRVEEGLPVACFDIAHEGSKITRFDTFQPALYRGRVYLIGSRRGAEERPELLEIKGKIPANVFGGPIVDERGTVIAVYGEAAPAGEASVKDLHYAPIVDGTLLKSWTERAEAVWVSPLAGVKR